MNMRGAQRLSDHLNELEQRSCQRSKLAGVEEETRTTNFGRYKRISRRHGPCCNITRSAARYVKQSRLFMADNRVRPPTGSNCPIAELDFLELVLPVHILGFIVSFALSRMCDPTLTSSHFLRKPKQNLAVSVRRLAEALSQLVKIPCAFT